MPRIACPSCGQQLQAPENAGGRKFRCSNCAGVVVVPHTAPRERPPALPVQKRSAPVRPTAPPPRIQAAGDDAEDEATYAPAPPDEKSAPEEPFPRKKKKRKKKKPVADPALARVPAWVWWWSSLLVTMLLIAGGIVGIGFYGHPLVAIWCALSLAFALPLSLVVFVASMFISNAIGAGIELAEFSTLIPKTLLLILLANVISLVPCAGGLMALAVWFIGAVLFFGLEAWEAKTLVLINWALGWAMWLLVISALTEMVSGQKKEGEKAPGDKADARLIWSVPLYPRPT